jgi:hypothetical protein
METFSVQPFRDKLDQIKVSINNSPCEARVDLMTMWKHCETLVDHLSKELVECRRLKKKTSSYLDLENKANTSIENLEVYITMGHLSF